MMRSFFAIVFAFSFCSIASAQVAGNPENWCREGLFTKESNVFKLGTAKGNRGSKIYFYDDAAECPDKGECRKKAYIVPGDEVVVSKTRGEYSCAWFTPAKGTATVGWVRSTDLKVLEGPFDIPLGEWLGEWKYGEKTIEFTDNKLDGWLNVTGNAFWKGIGDNIHIGALDGRAEPGNGILEYSDGDESACRVTMRLITNYLVVSDNMLCGGVNVSFSGIYRRGKTAKQ